MVYRDGNLGSCLIPGILTATSLSTNWPKTAPIEIFPQEPASPPVADEVNSMVSQTLPRAPHHSGLPGIHVCRRQA